MDIKATLTDALASFFPERASNTQPGAGSPANPAPSHSRQDDNTAPAVRPDGTRLDAVTPEQAALLSACEKAGIKTAADLPSVLSRAEDGDAFRAKADKDLLSAAVYRFGQEEGVKKAERATYKNLPPSEKLEVAEDWTKEQDEKLGISRTEGASRQTKPGANPQGVNAESSGGGSGKLWDRLTPEQKASGVKWGATTPEKQEAFAKNLLGTEAE